MGTERGERGMRREWEVHEMVEWTHIFSLSIYDSLLRFSVFVRLFYFILFLAAPVFVLFPVGACFSPSYYFLAFKYVFLPLPSRSYNIFSRCFYNTLRRACLINLFLIWECCDGKGEGKEMRGESIKTERKGKWSLGVGAACGKMSISAKRGREETGVFFF